MKAVSADNFEVKASSCPPVRAQTHFFWCAKPLGLRCLRHVYELCSYWQSLAGYGATGPRVVGVAISSDDPTAPAIEKLALEHGSAIYVDQDLPPAHLDLGWSVGWPHKLPGYVLDSFVWGAVNLHFGPLPAYRGSGTLPWAIINDESQYGVSLHYMDAELDTGPVIDVWYRSLPPGATTLNQIPLFEQLGYELFCHYAGSLFCEDVPVRDQAELANPLKAVPRLYTRRRLAAAYQLSLEWPFEKLYRYARALKTGKSKLPFVEEAGRRLYLVLGEGG